MMCLDKITKRYEPPDMAEREAWKVFDCFDGKTLLSWRTSERIRRGAWIKAKKRNICTDESGERYKSGFHCYRTKKEAMTYHVDDSHDTWEHHKLVKVKIRGVRLIGPQWGMKPPVLVADEMFVPE